MDEKENNNFSETLNNELPEGAAYDVFSENVSDKKPDPAREYLDRLYSGGIKLDNTDIRMTRSQYISERQKIDDYYKAESKKYVKYYTFALIVAAVGIISEIIVAGLQASLMQSNFAVAVNLLTMVKLAIAMLTPTACAAIIISITKSLLKLKKMKQKSIERLEQRKQEIMMLGQYDASR